MAQKSWARRLLALRAIAAVAITAAQAKVKPTQVCLGAIAEAGTGGATFDEWGKGAAWLWWLRHGGDQTPRAAFSRPHLFSFLRLVAVKSWV
jgi:hypothetical protein